MPGRCEPGRGDSFEFRKAKPQIACLAQVSDLRNAPLESLPRQGSDRLQAGSYSGFVAGALDTGNLFLRQRPEFPRRQARIQRNFANLLPVQPDHLVTTSSQHPLHLMVAPFSDGQ